MTKQFKVKIPKALEELKKKAKDNVEEFVGFNFPGDILKSVDPLEILAMLGSEIPAPLDTVWTSFVWGGHN